MSATQAAAAESSAKVTELESKVKELEEKLAEDMEKAAAAATEAAATETKIAEFESKVKELEEKLAAAEAASKAAPAAEDAAETETKLKEYEAKVGELEEKLAAAESLIPPAVVTAEFGQQFESDEANQHRLQLSTIRGQMSVLTARLMSLGKETTITEEDIANEQARLDAEEKDKAKENTAEGVAIKLTEEWNEEDIDKSHDQEGIVDVKSNRVVKDYKMISETLRVRCQMLVAKGQAARARIMALENELATALNDKEAMDQWARICHRRATGAEEARVGAMDELRDLKQRTRAIRLGQQTTYESEHVDVVAAAVEIEELKDRVLEVEEKHNLCKLQLEDAQRERDQFKMTIEAEERRKKVKDTWESLVSPKGVLGRMGLTPVRDFDDEDEEQVTTPPVEGEGIEKLDVSGSEAAAAIEAVEIEPPAAAEEEAKKEEAPAPPAEEEKKEEEKAVVAEEEKKEEEKAVVAEEPKKPESPAATGGFFGFFGFSQTTTETTETAEESTTTTTTTETIETTETKMATESSSVVVEEKAEDVEEAPKKKGGFSLGAAIDKHTFDSDDEDEDGAVVPAPPPPAASSSSSQVTVAETSESNVVVSAGASATESRTLEREEEETITTTVTKTITTTIIINSDGEEEEIVEEHVEEVVDEERKANESVMDSTAATNTTANSDDEDTGGNSFWARMNKKAGDVSMDSDSD